MLARALVAASRTSAMSVDEPIAIMLESTEAGRSTVFDVCHDGVGIPSNFAMWPF